MWKKTLILLSATCLLASCSDEKKKLEGTRKAVVDYTASVVIDTPDEKPIFTEELTLNDGWPQAGGQADHALPSLNFSNQFSPLWTSSAGSGSTSEAKLLSTPITHSNEPGIEKEILYSLDTHLRVSAINVNTGQRLWRESIAPEDRNDAISGGGVAYANDRIYVTSPHAEVVCLEAATGKVMWRSKTEGPVRAAPTVDDGRVYALSINNQLNVFDGQTGEKLWSHAGITEHAGLLGTASPAVSKGVVIVAYSSGEVYALKAETGYELWSETLSSTRRPDSLSSLAHIRALPIIDGNQVIIVGHNQKISVFDLRNGQKMWEHKVGGIHTPAVAEGYIFLINNFNELICLKESTGKVIWATKLPKDPKNPHRIMWSGPILAAKQLVLTGLNGEIAAYAHQDGKKVKVHNHGTPMSLSPILSNNFMYILDDNGDVTAYQ